MGRLEANHRGMYPDSTRWTAQLLFPAAIPMSRASPCARWRRPSTHPLTIDRAQNNCGEVASLECDIFYLDPEVSANVMSVFVSII